MDGVKGILTSKTIWGAAAVVAATVANIAGYDLGDPTGWATDIVALLGAGLAIVGRITAVKKIGKIA